MSQGLEISSLSALRTGQKRLFSDDLTVGRPPIHFLPVVRAGADVPLEPAGSRLPVAQNNLHTSEVHLGVLVLNPYSVLKQISFQHYRLKAFQYFILIL